MILRLARQLGTLAGYAPVVVRLIVGSASRSSAVALRGLGNFSRRQGYLPGYCWPGL